MYCAIVIPYRVRVVIPAAEMWEAGHERPDFMLQNMVGTTIDFIITKVDRESGFVIGSRRLAACSQRYFFAHRPALCREGARLKCRLLSVGPRRCLVECYGHDLNMIQRDLRYTAIPDLRNEYHPGQELDCVVKSYDPVKEALRISVKETESNPFEDAELRHPAGSRRQAVIAGKYGGGVFCNLPDGTVCMCNYSYQEDATNLMSCGKDKATKLFRELDKDGIGLIERKKQGQGRPTRIYVKNFILPPAPQTAENQQFGPLDSAALVSGEIFLAKGGQSLSRKQIWREMKSLCGQAGVEPSKVFPNNLRRLFAAAFYRVCRDIVKLADVLGHSSIETTRIYLLSTGAERARYLNRLRLIC